MQYLTDRRTDDAAHVVGHGGRNRGGRGRAYFAPDKLWMEEALYSQLHVDLFSDG